jgi:hypothetical protein
MISLHHLLLGQICKPRKDLIQKERGVGDRRRGNAMVVWREKIEERECGGEAKAKREINEVSTKICGTHVLGWI